MILSVLAIVMLLFTGEQILKFWTDNQVEMDFSFFAMMLAAVAINALWITSSVVPSATNQHHKIALLFSLGTLSAVLVAMYLVPKLGLTGVAFSILLVDLAMALVVVKTSLKILDDNIFGFLKFLF
jgi:O-antigen/teichoic acid export membrane protein